MKFLLIAIVATLVGCASGPSEWENDVSRGFPGAHKNNMRFVPKYWSI